MIATTLSMAMTTTSSTSVQPRRRRVRLTGSSGWSGAGRRSLSDNEWLPSIRRAPMHAQGHTAERLTAKENRESRTALGRGPSPHGADYPAAAIALARSHARRSDLQDARRWISRRVRPVSPSGNTVYAAGFHSGKRTTAISEGAVSTTMSTSSSPSRAHRRRPSASHRDVYGPALVSRTFRLGTLAPRAFSSTRRRRRRRPARAHARAHAAGPSLGPAFAGHRWRRAHATGCESPGRRAP